MKLHHMRQARSNAEVALDQDALAASFMQPSLLFTTQMAQLRIDMQGHCDSPSVTVIGQAMLRVQQQAGCFLPC